MPLWQALHASTHGQPPLMSTQVVGAGAGCTRGSEASSATAQWTWRWPQVLVAAMVSVLVAAVAAVVAVAVVVVAEHAGTATQGRRPPLGPWLPLLTGCRLWRPWGQQNDTPRTHTRTRTCAAWLLAMAAAAVVAMAAVGGVCGVGLG